MVGGWLHLRLSVDTFGNYRLPAFLPDLPLSRLSPLSFLSRTTDSYLSLPSDSSQVLPLNYYLYKLLQRAPQPLQPGRPSAAKSRDPPARVTDQRGPCCVASDKGQKSPGDSSRFLGEWVCWGSLTPLEPWEAVWECFYGASKCFTQRASSMLLSIHSSIVDAAVHTLQHRRCCCPYTPASSMLLSIHPNIIDSPIYTSKHRRCSCPHT